MDSAVVSSPISEEAADQQLLPVKQGRIGCNFCVNNC